MSGYRIPDALALVSIKCLSLICCLISMYLFLISPAYSANWVEVEVGEDSGDTYLWPYFTPPQDCRWGEYKKK